MAQFIRPGNFLAFLLVLTAACASSGGATRRDMNILTRDEMTTARVTHLLEAVERLRPRWLQVRGPRSINSDTQVLVYVDRANMGGPDALRQFDAKDVAQLRYLDAAQAYATLNLPRGVHVPGVIVIELNPGVVPR